MRIREESEEDPESQMVLTDRTPLPARNQRRDLSRQTDIPK
jgi:hypothetical protein